MRRTTTGSYGIVTCSAASRARIRAALAAMTALARWMLLTTVVIVTVLEQAGQILARSSLVKLFHFSPIASGLW